MSNPASAASGENRKRNMREKSNGRVKSDATKRLASLFDKVPPPTQEERGGNCAVRRQCQYRRMSNRILRAVLFTFFCLTIAPLIHAAPAKRNITEKDLFDFVWIGNPQISSDGARVAYVHVTVNEKKDGYDTAIWMVPTAGNEAPRQLTSGPRDSGPCENSGATKISRSTSAGWSGQI